MPAASVLAALCHRTVTLSSSLHHHHHRFPVADTIYDQLVRRSQEQAHQLQENSITSHHTSRVRTTRNPLWLQAAHPVVCSFGRILRHRLERWVRSSCQRCNVSLPPGNACHSAVLPFAKFAGL